MLQRYYGWYASRARGRRRQAAHGDEGSATEVPCVRGDQRPAAVRAARRRWAELLRRLFEVEPLRCPRCGDAMRIVAFITVPLHVDRILAHLRRPAAPQRRPRAPPRGRRAAASRAPA